MFTADKVVWEFVADTDKLDKAYKAEVRNSKKQGDKIGDSFEKGFDGEKRGRGLMAGLASGVRKGAPALKTALKASTALATAGLGIGLGFAAVARGAIASTAEMKVLADVAGLSAERFQEVRFAASQYGIEQDKVSDILKDVNDKFGDFFATGAGPLADFFENVAPKVGVMAEDFRDLSSDQALGLYVDTLQRAGVNQQDMAFYMEAVASDATMLIPLFRDNGRELKEFSRQARDAGMILSNEAAQGAQDADQKFNELGATLRSGLVNTIVELAPEIEDLTQRVIDLIPTLVDWTSNIIEGFHNVGANLEWLSDQWTASPFGSGMADADPTSLSGVENRLQDILALKQTAERVWAADGGIWDALTRSQDEKDYWTLSVKIFGAEAVDQMREEGVNMRDVILDEYNRVADMLVRFQPPMPSGSEEFDENRPENAGLSMDERIAYWTERRRVEAEAAAEEERLAAEERARQERRLAAKRQADIDAAKAEQERMREAQARLAAAEKMREENLTAEERYQAELAAIREVENDPMLLEIAGGQETIMRARVQALVDYAAAADDVGVAHIALAEAINDGTLTADAALDATERLNTEFGIFTKAQLEANEVLQEKNDELVTQIEYQRELAEASGDYTEVTRLTRELEVLRRKGDLLRENIALTEKEAEARARGEVNELSKAQDLQGFDNLKDDTDTGLDAELARIDERERAKLELLESYRTAETEALRDFEALKTEIEREAEEERRAIKLQALDDQLAMAEGVFGGISDLLRQAGKEDSKAAKAAAKAEKVIAIGRATVNTALGVSRALAEQPFPLNFITAGLVGAAGAVQIATIASSFKDGVISLKGPGTERSDSIPARLSKGESVITARATRGNELGLARLNAGMSPEEAFGIGRMRYGMYKDGVIAVGAPMARVPDVTTPDTSEFSSMATSAPMSTVTNKFDITVKDDKAAYAYADRKARETEAKVPGLVAADDAKKKRARPR